MEEIHMKNVKKIAILSLVVAGMTGFTQAATHHESKPDATLRLSSGGFALGIGVNWGSGTLTYRGKKYPVKVKGLSVGRVGMTSFPHLLPYLKSERRCHRCGRSRHCRGSVDQFGMVSGCLARFGLRRSHSSWRMVILIRNQVHSICFTSV